MLNRQTVFVVGAGASKEFGLPIGLDLQNTIAKFLDIQFDAGAIQSGSDEIWEAIKRLDPKRSRDLQHAGWKVRDGLPLSNSIDNFIDVHRTDRDIRTVGRLAIAKAIADAERSSRLFFGASNTRNEIDFNSLADTWLLRLFRILQEGVPKENAETMLSGASFVVFNYDRCLEHFLYRAIRSIYRLPDDLAARIVSKAQIIHTYGTIGRLPWQPGEDGHFVEFGSKSHQLELMAESLFTYTEPATDDLRARARRLVSTAEQLCFLGFSFQKQNVDLLTPDGGTTADILATTYGMSSYNNRAIELDLRNRLDTPAGVPSRATHLEQHMTCAQLVEAYSRAFA